MSRKIKDLFNIYGVIGLFALFFLAIASFIIFDFVVDDSFISLIYARNFALHGELVANLGERTFGFTNFLFVIIEAGLIKFFGNFFQDYNIIIIVKIFLLVSAAFCLILPWRYTVLKQNSAGKMFWFVSLASATPFVIWTSAGLETTFLATLLIIVSISFLGLNIRQEKSLHLEVIMLLASAAAVLTRFDTILIVAPIILSHGIRYLWLDFKWWLKFILFTIAPIAGMVFFTYLYYGKPLPQAFYFKGFKGGQVYGLTHFFEFLFLMNINFIHIWLIASGLKLSYSKEKITNYFSLTMRAYVPVIIGISLYIIYIISQGPVHMMFSYRFYMPILPLVYLGSSIAVAMLIQSASSIIPFKPLPWENLYIRIKSLGLGLILASFLSIGLLIITVILWLITNLSKIFPSFHASPSTLMEYFNHYFFFILLYIIALCFSAISSVSPSFIRKISFYRIKTLFKWPINITESFLMGKKKNILIMTLLLFGVNVISFAYAYSFNMNFTILRGRGDAHTNMSLKGYTKLMHYFKETGEIINKNFPAETKMFSWAAGIVPYLAKTYAFDNQLIATPATSQLEWIDKKDLLQPFDLIVMPCHPPLQDKKFELWKKVPEVMNENTTGFYDATGPHYLCIYSKLSY